MSTVDFLSSLGTTTDTSTSITGSTNVLGKEEFLNLLVTQLQYQDPLDPMNNEEFVAQMAQFSSLEQLINLNEAMTESQYLQASINNSQAVNLIGKDITVVGNTVQISEGELSESQYVLTDDAAKVTISIFDEEGSLVRTLELGEQSAGQHDIEFDGKDNNGNTLDDGTYTFQIDAYDAEGNSIELQSYCNVRVDSVTFQDGVVYLKSGDSLFMLGDVVEVRAD